PDLHSFPTRRSSDLAAQNRGWFCSLTQSFNNARAPLAFASITASNCADSAAVCTTHPWRAGCTAVTCSALGVIVADVNNFLIKAAGCTVKARLNRSPPKGGWAVTFVAAACADCHCTQCGSKHNCSKVCCKKAASWGSLAAVTAAPAYHSWPSQACQRICAKAMPKR